MTQNKGDRVLQARIAAHASWAQTQDRAARTANARKALLDKFERAVDPDGLLTPEERAFRAEHARKEHYLRLSRKSAQVRRHRSCRNQHSGGDAA